MSELTQSWLWRTDRPYKTVQKVGPEHGPHHYITEWRCCVVLRGQGGIAYTTGPHATQTAAQREAAEWGRANLGNPCPLP